MAAEPRRRRDGAQANAHLKRTNTFATSNPQTQAASFAPEAEAPTITVTSPVEGQGFKLGSTVLADFTCGDNAAVESCIGTVADGAALDTGTLGNKVFKVTAIDTAGNITTKEVAYMVNSIDFHGLRAVARWTPTLALTLPATTATFGAVHAGPGPGIPGTAAAR